MFCLRIVGHTSRRCSLVWYRMARLTDLDYLEVVAMGNDIIVSTIIDSFNYGTVMQAVATNEILGRYGDVKFVDYVRPLWTKSGWRRSIIRDDKYPLPVNIARLAAQIPNRQKGETIFRPFVERNLSLVNDERFLTPGGEFSDDAVYCVGSDQTWNSEYNNGLDPVFFLKNVPSNRKKIAFCASFGRPNVPDWEKEDTAKLLADFDAISVREKSGVAILESMGIPNAVSLYDPVLLCDKSLWTRLAKRIPVCGDKYILVYDLNPNPAMDEFVKKLSLETGAKVKIVTFDWKKAVPKTFEKVYLPTIEQWLALFRDASWVVTDSFHGTCFSILLNKDFFVFEPPKYSVRLVDVLTDFRLLGRIIPSNDVAKMNDIELIDWSGVNNILEEYRLKASAFLDGAL